MRIGSLSWLHILGFNAQLIASHYDIEEKLAAKDATAQTIKNELGGSIEDISKVEGMLLLKQQDAAKKQKLLDAFDFRAQDKGHTKELVDEIDDRIAALNAARYSLQQSRKRISASLEEDQILFNPDDAQIIFQQAGVLFQGQIKKDFQQLISFNRAITEERRGYLQSERTEVEAELTRVNGELNNLGKQRSGILAFLTATAMYSASTREFPTRWFSCALTSHRLNANEAFCIASRNSVQTFAHLARSEDICKRRLKENVEKQNADNDSLFSAIRVYFSEIVEDVIDRKALLSVSPNRQGHLEFKAEILDEAGNSTSADLGHTYRKLLCIAFDLAVLRGHLDVKFPRFVFHDGIFESLDDRKKVNKTSSRCSAAMRILESNPS